MGTKFYCMLLGEPIIQLDEKVPKYRVELIKSMESFMSKQNKLASFIEMFSKCAIGFKTQA